MRDSTPHPPQHQVNSPTMEEVLSMEVQNLLLAAANRMNRSEKIFATTSPTAYAYLMAKAAAGDSNLDDAPPWLAHQLMALLDPVT